MIMGFYPMLLRFCLPFAGCCHLPGYSLLGEYGNQAFNNCRQFYRFKNPGFAAAVF